MLFNKNLTDPKPFNGNANVNKSLGFSFRNLLGIKLSVKCQRLCAVQHTVILLWDWNAEWQILRQSSVIQDGLWACQAQLYQPHLTLQPKKENMKGKTGMMKWCPMRTCGIYHCVIFIHFEIIWSKNRKRWWINLQMLANECCEIISIHDIHFCLLKKITWLQKSPKHDPNCPEQSVPTFQGTCCVLLSSWMMSRQ